MTHQLSLLKRRSFAQDIFRILARGDVVLIDLHLRLTLDRQSLQSVEPLDFFFELHSHAKLVHVQLVDGLE